MQTRRESEAPIRIDEHMKTGEVFVIPDPQFRLNQLEQVRQEVAVLLSLG